MDIFVLLFLNSIKMGVMHTCHELQVQDLMNTDKYADTDKLSCLLDLSLEQCALECLLVTKCKSINFISNTRSSDNMCELLVDEGDSTSISVENGSLYVDIRHWPQNVATTCMSRPCADNQRCIPTIPYRCMDIDCGIPPVLPYAYADTNMYPIWTDTTIGSRANYACRNVNKAVAYVYGTGLHRCHRRNYRICNSDSMWMTQAMYCVNKY